MPHDEAVTDGSDAPLALTHEQRAVEFLRRAMRSASHWRASMAMAKCLGVPHTKLLLSTDKNDTTNLVWTTVLVLLSCATQLADLHALWYDMADAAVAWLYAQPHFVERRDDLVASACALLQLRDVATMLTTVFPDPKDGTTRALEAALGDWKLCYLDEPPYSAYYWNEQTNLSTWRNPLETAQLEKERLEEKQRRTDVLAKVLPMRIKINRDGVMPPIVSHCQPCGPLHRPATVCCLACDKRFYCDDCCDLAHADRTKLAHIATDFCYVQCHGIKGFPSQAKANN